MTLLTQGKNIGESKRDVVIVDVFYVEGADAGGVDDVGFFVPDMDVGAGGGVLALLGVFAEFFGFDVCSWDEDVDQGGFACAAFS